MPLNAGAWKLCYNRVVPSMQLGTVSPEGGGLHIYVLDVCKKGGFSKESEKAGIKPI